MILVVIVVTRLVVVVREVVILMEVVILRQVVILRLVEMSIQVILALAKPQMDSHQLME